VTASAGSATAGQQRTGYFVVHPDTGPDITVYVTLNVGAGSSGGLVATPSSVSITWPDHPTAPVHVTGTNTTPFSVFSDTSWMNIGKFPGDRITGYVNSDFTISPSTANLSPGTYQGTVKLLDPTDLTTTTVSVTLVVNALPAAVLNLSA